MSDVAYLTLLLDAPLMSWGYASRFQRRTTALHPTRSGILGMICAAMGACKGSDPERELLARLENVGMTVYTLRRKHEGENRTLDIRRLEDFHTVRETRSAENKIKKDAVITHRQYLMDARFGVILVGVGDVIAEVASGLRNPKWGVWFGRKSCIPATPVLVGTRVATEQDAVAVLEKASGVALTSAARVEEAASFADGTDTIRDAPVDFKTREFKPRRIRQVPEVVAG